MNPCSRAHRMTVGACVYCERDAALKELAGVKYLVRNWNDALKLVLSPADYESTFTLEGGDEVNAANLALRDVVIDRCCQVKRFSSRTCERGTPGCEVRHEGDVKCTKP